jgi:hypothetical protein
MVSATEFLAAGRNFKRQQTTFFGQPITVRSLSGADRELLRARATDGKPLTASELVTLAAVDESGAPVFTLEQAQELNACDGGEIDRLAVEILEVSGLAAKSEDAAAKN